MGKPVIGITCGYDSTATGGRERLCVYADYVEAIRAAGGAVVLLPTAKDADADPEISARLLDAVDGVLLPGGIDVDPIHFEEEPLPQLGMVDPDLDTLELGLARLALQRNKPVLGVCRGCQVLNVAAGGSLYQDIATQLKTTVKHSQLAPRWYPTHEVHFEHGSRVSQILGTQLLRVNSFHHQSIKAVAPEFRISGKSRDAVVEAVESKVHSFAIGVQWHPECLYARYPVFLRLFDALVTAAEGVAAGVGARKMGEGGGS